MDPIRRSHALSLVLVLALLASGAACAAAGETGLYDQPVLTLDPGMHTTRINGADVSATGAYPVTGSDDKTVRVWAAQTGRLLRTIRLPQGPGPVGRGFAVAISPDGALVAAGGWTGAAGQPRSIYLFDLFDRDTGWRAVARDKANGGASYGAAFAADGRLATTSYDGSLRLYDGAFRRVATAQTTDGTQPVGLAFSPAGDRLAVGYRDTTAVSLVDGRTLTPLPGPDTRGIDHGNLIHVAWAADGAPLVLRPDEQSRSLAIAPDGRRFVLGTEWYLHAFAADGTPRWTQPAPAPVLAIAVTADGRLVVAASHDGTLRWHRLEDGREVLALFPLADRRHWVAWTPEGVYAATPGAYGVLRWHVNRGWDTPAEAIPVDEIPETRRPEVIRLVLQEMGTPGALAVAELTKIRTAIQRRTRTAVAPAPGCTC